MQVNGKHSNYMRRTLGVAQNQKASKTYLSVQHILIIDRNVKIVTAEIAIIIEIAPSSHIFFHISKPEYLSIAPSSHSVSRDIIVKLIITIEIALASHSFSRIFVVNMFVLHANHGLKGIFP